jgi:hypothetical protein
METSILKSIKDRLDLKNQSEGLSPDERELLNELTFLDEKILAGRLSMEKTLNPAPGQCPCCGRKL